jgi:hypothetical protein
MLRDVLQNVVSCLVHSPVRRIGGGRGAGEGISLGMGSDEPVLLRGTARLHLSFRLRYRLIAAEAQPGSWQAAVIAYQYTLLDQDKREILAFHLHPEGPSHLTTPHIHLGPGAGLLRPELTRAHVPTGPVTLAAVVRLAIVGFSVGPLRSDWDATVRRAEQVLVPDAR